MDVGFHGSDEIQTPNIDALAYHGMSLHRHYGLPTCSPSRSALLTGKHAIHTGMQYPLAAGNPVGIPLNESLLPQYLKTLGYQTHLVGKWHLGYHTKKHLPTNRGFDTHFGYYSGYISYFDGIHISQNVAGLDVRRNEEPVWHELSGKYATRVFTNEAIHIINDHDNEQPLFLEVAHLAPHSGNTGARLQINDIDKNEQQFGYIKNESRKLYAGMVKELDDSVGQIIFALNETDLLKDSIVIFLSDNGAPSYEPIWHTTNFGSNYPLRGEKASLHEGGIRTVGAIWSPLFKYPSTIYTQLFHLVDWLPTLFAAAGGDSSQLKHLDGINHWDQLVHNNKLQINERNLLLNIYNGNEAITNGKWKLIKSNKNSSFLFANNYYGSKGKNEGTPEYNISKILASPTGTLLQSTISYSENKNNVNNPEEKFLQLREKNTIICEDFENTIDDCDDYCLFNLLIDPCERNNLVLKEQKIYHEFKNLLDKYRNEVIEPEENIFDIKSSPEYWNNYWNPWLSDSGTHLRENTYNLISFSLVIIYIYTAAIFQ